jgi:hypothetical protein
MHSVLDKVKIDKLRVVGQFDALDAVAASLSRQMAA